MAQHGGEGCGQRTACIVRRAEAPPGDEAVGALYRIGLALLDLNNPTRVLRRLSSWVLAPTAPYERTGDVPNVVFPCGLIHDEASDELRLYYGAADSTVCLATARLRDVLDALRQESVT